MYVLEPFLIGTKMPVLPTIISCKMFQDFFYWNIFRAAKRNIIINLPFLYFSSVKNQSVLATCGCPLYVLWNFTYQIMQFHAKNFIKLVKFLLRSFVTVLKSYYQLVRKYLHKYVIGKTVIKSFIMCLYCCGATC